MAPRTPAGRLPLRALTVLYDPDCALCAFVAGWLARQRQLVPISLVPTGSAEARRRFPALDHAATAREVTAVGDRGQVYRGDSAWIVCLWALAGQRRLAHTLTRPAGRRMARAAVLGAAKYRGAAVHSRAARPPARPKATYGMAPGWTYDRVTGWSQAPVPTPTLTPAPPSTPAPTPTAAPPPAPGGPCADGCGPGPG
ncbi:thiol-disulfide oxidoreductase DCC family protein [Actinacidiphila sp. bgisy144]|uniref:thiol-disulfide oxidoreductase DCC family protein n=1 Tax=Actinacidiphila sp. bgisy144 TaxID=3413791 RepID=UPI003EBB26AA